jgi:hypothetical protein
LRQNGGLKFKAEGPISGNLIRRTNSISDTLLVPITNGFVYGVENYVFWRRGER